MSRLPRHRELLKTGFTAEAVSAARFRAYAARADRDGQPNLARHWRALAEEKDRLAMAQLEAAGKVQGSAADLGAALAEEAYENDVLYPKMIRDVAGDEDTAQVFQQVVEAQKEHLAHLSRLQEAYHAAQGDVEVELPQAAVEVGA